MRRSFRFGIATEPPPTFPFHNYNVKELRFGGTGEITKVAKTQVFQRHIVGGGVTLVVGEARCIGVVHRSVKRVF